MDAKQLTDFLFRRSAAPEIRELPVGLPLPSSRAFHRGNAPFALTEVRGPDAAEYLQRLCTQDVLSMEDGAVRPAAFLDAKGKLLTTCLVLRTREAHFLETATEQAQKLRELLERYHFTEKLSIREVTGWCDEIVVSGHGTRRVMESSDTGMVFVFDRRGIGFRRAHSFAPGVRAEESRSDLGPHLAECLRMLAGLVRVGVETEPTTLALEADLDDHISTTKGCYTGQEIVARINTYGHTNRRLCLLLLAPGEPITAPQPLHEPEDQLAVGRVMHAVPIPDRRERLGVGYLPKDFQAISTKLALADGSAVEVIGYEPLPPLPA